MLIIQTRQALIAGLSQAVSLEAQICQMLASEWLRIGNKTLFDLFLVGSLRTSSSLTPITRASYPQQFDAYVKLFKASILVSRFKLSKRQLRWLFTYGSNTTDPASAWLNLDSLPLELASLSDGSGNYKKWERLLALTKLRDALPLGEDLLDTIFSQARSTGANETAHLEALSKGTSWNLDEVKYVVGPNGFALPFPDAYQDEAGLSLLVKYFVLLRKVGCQPSDLNDLASPKPTEEHARKAVQIVKAKYDQPSWNTVARPLRNILREKRRESLVSYLLANPSASGNTWRTSNELFAYYLIDVEMGPCQLTSRIKQGICSVQLFTQRCLMNLEPDVIADVEADNVWTQWESWLKSQVISSANRLVYMHSENFLEPSLRDDKTPFFKDLENDISQIDIINDVAEEAFASYLEKLMVISRLEVKSYYHELERTDSGVQGVDTLHVFATTRGIPKELYYRQRRDGRIWEAWNKVELDVQSEHIVPIVWNRKLHLFWLQWAEKPYPGPVVMPEPTKEVQSNGTFWEVKLCWSEKRAGRWQGKKISDSLIALPKSDNSTFAEKDVPNIWDAYYGHGRSAVTCGTEITPDGKLRVHLLSDKLYGNLVGYFEFDGVKGSPMAFDTQKRNLDIQIANPFYYSRIDRMAFTEYNSDALTDPSGIPDFPLELPVNIPKQAEPPTHWLTRAEATSDKVKALEKTPVGPYSLVSAPQDQQFVTQRPFFFQHTRPSRSFFVEPIKTYFIFNSQPIFGLKDPSRMVPSWVDGALLGGYIDRLDRIKPVVAGPELPRPGDTGVLTNIRTYMPLNPQFNTIGVGSAITLPREKFHVVFPETVDLSSRRIPSPWLGKFEIPGARRFKFSLFYHPYAPDFMRNLNRDGIPGLLQRPVQALKPAPSDTFEQQYGPVSSLVDRKYLPDETVDFSVGGSFSQYNWVLFYHVPILIADRLSSNQRFKEAQMWLRYIFYPTDTLALRKPKKFWKTKPFVAMQDEDYYKQNISNVFRALASRRDSAAMDNLTADQREWLDNLEVSIDEWRRPFCSFPYRSNENRRLPDGHSDEIPGQSHSLGDQLFSRGTMESINVATQLYIMASDILGRRPADIPARAVPVPQTFNSLDRKLDHFSNALVQIEELIPNFAATASDQVLVDPTTPRKGLAQQCSSSASPATRNSCVVRELALWDPPIDPMLLIKAKAAGVDISSILSDVAVVAPNHRYTVLAAKAAELVSEVKSFGSSLLAALEKQDGEGLSLLHSEQEVTMLKAVREIKNKQVNEVEQQVNALVSGKDVIVHKRTYYGSREFMSGCERTHMGMENTALAIQAVELETQIVAAALSLVPEFKIGVPTTVGATFGGEELGNSLSKFAAALSSTAGVVSRGAAMAQILGGYVRRQEEWTFQRDNAIKEIAQIDIQINAATIKQSMALKELENHDLQTENAKKVDDYMKSKFTNRELYNWMSKRVSLYFRAYTLAYEAAKRAERAYCHDLGVSGSSFIQFGYWDNLQKGLLAGERLMVDLKHLDAAYLQGDTREYELTKNVSIAHLNPVALLQFKQGGSASSNSPKQSLI
ncbi:hypothetical protein PG995_009135 [Apiospora arundinis]